MYSGTVSHSYVGVPPLNQSFVVGPGFLPIPYKTVVSITLGEYIELACLLKKPSEVPTSGPTISIDGRVVLSQAIRALGRLVDVTQWVQAFSIYTLTMVSSFLQRASDLLKY